MRFCSTCFTRFSFCLYSVFPVLEQNIRGFLECLRGSHRIISTFGDPQSDEICFETSNGTILLWSISSQSIHTLSLKNSSKSFYLHINFHYPKLYCFYWNKVNNSETSSEFHTHFVYVYDVKVKTITKFTIELSKSTILGSIHLIRVCPLYLLIGSTLYSIVWIATSTLKGWGKITINFQYCLNVNCWFPYWITFYYHTDKKWYIIYSSYHENQSDFIFLRCHDNRSFQTFIRTKSEDKSSRSIWSCLDNKIVFAKKFPRTKHFNVFSYLIK